MKVGRRPGRMGLRELRPMLALLFIVCGCEDKNRVSTPPPEHSRPAAVQSTAVAPTPSTSHSVHPPPATSTAGPRVVGHWVENLPKARSKVPTVGEWERAPDCTREVRARDALAECDVKLVREWLRVTCRETKGPFTLRFFPESATVTRGRDGETYTFQKDGVASVVVPLRPRVAREAILRYDMSGFDEQVLTVEWPGGETRPKVVLTDRPAPRPDAALD